MGMTQKAQTQAAQVEDLRAYYVDRYSQPYRLGNPIRDLNPLVLFVFLLAIAIASVALPWPVLAPTIGCVLFVVIAILAGRAKQFIPLYLKLFLGVGSVLFILRVFLIAPEEGATVYWSWGDNLSLSTTSLAAAARFTLVVMSLCGALALFFQLVPAKNLMLALQGVGLSSRSTYVVLSSFQSITDLQKMSKVVVDAQKARGIEMEGGFFRRVAAFFPIITPVFLAAIGQTEERALALDARAFNVPEKPSQVSFLPKVGVGQWLLVLVSLVIAVGSIVLAVVL